MYLNFQLCFRLNTPRVHMSRILPSYEDRLSQTLLLGCLSFSGRTALIPFFSAIKANWTSQHNSVLRTSLAYRGAFCLILSDHIQFPEGNPISYTSPISRPLLWPPLSCAYSLLSLPKPLTLYAASEVTLRTISFKSCT